MKLISLSRPSRPKFSRPLKCPQLSYGASKWCKTYTIFIAIFIALGLIEGLTCWAVYRSEDNKKAESVRKDQDGIMDVIQENLDSNFRLLAYGLARNAAFSSIDGKYISRPNLDIFQQYYFYPLKNSAI